MSGIAEIQKTVLALPVAQRVIITESLLDSMPPLTEECSEAEELAEAERRDHEIESGAVKPLTEAEFWRCVDGDRN